MLIAADSQCFSYLFDAIEGVAEPTGPLAEQQRALLRCYLYQPGTLYATPKVIDECSEIRNISRREMHTSYFSSLFDVVDAHDERQTLAILGGLLGHHSGQADCRIVAEAIVGGADVLLTYDSDLIAGLASHSGSLRVLRPADYWSELALPRGAKPYKVPHPGGQVAGKLLEPNPLAAQFWWRW